MTPDHERRRPRTRHAATAKPRFDPVVAIGELLLIAGALTGAFFGWKMVIQPWALGHEQQQAAVEIVEMLAERSDAEIPDLDDAGIPIRPAPDQEGERFAVLYAPALGADWMRPITAHATDDSLTSNLGHYGTSDPAGAIGNFALAGHRTGYGDPFVDLPRLAVGDRLIVETIDGWYVYLYRNGEYVTPDAIEILDPVPMHPGEPARDRFLTLQTCNPPYHGGPELFIGYSTLTEFVPRADGPPEDVQAVLAAAEGGSR